MSQQKDGAMLACAQISIVGVGDWGCKRLDEIPQDVVSLARLVAVHTDPLVLSGCRAPTLVCLEEGRSRPDPSGTDPHSGYARLQEAVAGSDLILVLGNPDSDALQELVSDVVRSCLAVGTVVAPVCPASSTGEQLLWGVDRFGFPQWHTVKMILSIPNMTDAGEVVAALCQALYGVILVPSVVGVDFADVRTVLDEAGLAFVALGKAKGVNRAYDTASALLETTGLARGLASARAVLAVIIAGDDLAIEEFTAVGEWICRYVSADATVVMGVVLDESIEELGMKVLMVATGIDGGLSGIVNG